MKNNASSRFFELYGGIPPTKEGTPDISASPLNMDARFLEKFGQKAAPEEDSAKADGVKPKEPEGKGILSHIGDFASDAGNYALDALDNSARGIARTTKNLVLGVPGFLDAAVNTIAIPTHVYNGLVHGKEPNWSNLTGDVNNAINNLTGGYTKPRTELEQGSENAQQFVSSFLAGNPLAKAGQTAVKAIPKVYGSKLPKKALNSILKFFEKGSEINKTNIGALLGATGVDHLTKDLVDENIDNPGLKLLAKLVAGFGGGVAGGVAANLSSPVRALLNQQKISKESLESLLGAGVPMEKIAPRDITTPTLESIYDAAKHSAPADTPTGHKPNLAEQSVRKELNYKEGSNNPDKTGESILKAVKGSSKSYKEEFESKFNFARKAAEKKEPKGVPVDYENTSKALAKVVDHYTKNITPDQQALFWKSHLGKAVKSLMEIGTTPENKNFKEFNIKPRIKELNESKSPILDALTEGNQGFDIPTKIGDTPKDLQKIWNANKDKPGFTNSAFGKNLKKLLGDIKKHDKTRYLEPKPESNASDLYLRANQLAQAIKNPELHINTADPGKIKLLVSALREDANIGFQKTLNEIDPGLADSFKKTRAEYHKYSKDGGHKDQINTLVAQAADGHGNVFDRYYAAMAGKKEKAHGQFKDVVEKGLTKKQAKVLNDSVLARLGTADSQFSLETLSKGFKELNNEQKVRILSTYSPEVRSQLQSALKYASKRSEIENFSIASGRIHGTSNWFSPHYYVKKLLSVLTPNKTIKILNDPKTLKHIIDTYKSSNIDELQHSMKILGDVPFFKTISRQALQAIGRSAGK